MVVLVGWASRYGSTRGVAARLAAVLRDRGLEVDLRRLGATEQVTDYDAFVLGSAVYSGAWLPEATDFVKRHEAALARRPVWTFTVGRLRGQRGPLRRVSWPDAGDVGEIAPSVQPREHRFFDGALNPAVMSRAERALFRSLGGRYGDFRDWPQIEEWAGAIAHDLTAPTPATRVARE